MIADDFWITRASLSYTTSRMDANGVNGCGRRVLALGSYKPYLLVTSNKSDSEINWQHEPVGTKCVIAAGFVSRFI